MNSQGIQHSSREQRDKEFSEVERRAKELLFEPSLANRQALTNIGYPRFVLWHFPAFGDYRSWCVCKYRPRPEQGPQLLARQLTWRRTEDAKRFTDPMVGLVKGFGTSPSVEVADNFVGDQDVNARLDALSKIVIPVSAIERFIGTDGETFGFSGSFNEMRVEWWCSGPACWKPLIEWASNTRSWLADVCNRPSSHVSQG